MATRKEFDRIVLPVDGSDPAIQATKKAISLAKRLGLEILAIFVVDVGPFTDILPPEQEYQVWKTTIEEEAQKTLNNVEKMGEKNGIKIHTMLLKGNPTEKILNETKKDDLVIMGSKGRSSLERIVIGSVPEKVLHHTPSSVMIVR